MPPGKLHIKLISYLPLFFLLCLSGNPYFTNQKFAKPILVIYTLIFGMNVLFISSKNLDKKFFNYALITILIVIITAIAQKFVLGFVSYLSVAAIITKILLALFTVIYYNQKRINIFDTYIKIFTFLVIMSFPFFLINQFVQFGLSTNNIFLKSIIIFTFTPNNPDYDFNYGIIRNPGMFWEAGAFAGYLLLAIVFIIIQNKKFIIHKYKKEFFWIVLGIITTMSTTGYIILGIIFIILVIQHFKKGKFILVSSAIITVIFVYSNFAFMQSKIEAQYEQALNLRLGDYSNTRFGSLIMDAYYIKEHPIVGNGTNISTRYKYNLEVIDDIGNGNGMSNFIASWGLSLFLFWLYCSYKFVIIKTNSKSLAFGILFIILLILQGEQFLNFPIFLMFFVLPSYVNFYKKNNNLD